MRFIFEDVAERPIKAVRLKSVKAKAILPGGMVMEERFHGRKRPGAAYRKRGYRFKTRPVSSFTARAEWIKMTPKFDLEVLFPFKETDHRLTFNYEVPGGEIPFHRR